MNKEELKNKLEASFMKLAESVETQSDEAFFAPFGEKWSIAENILHLSQSAKIMNQALQMPREMLAQMFGKSDGNSRTYEEVIANYHAALQAGAVARGAFVPELPENPNKGILIESFKKHHQVLSNYLNGWTEEELDSYRLKHPLLKEITMREMYYFMDYHINHHLKAVELIVVSC